MQAISLMIFIYSYPIEKHRWIEKRKEGKSSNPSITRHSFLHSLLSQDKESQNKKLKVARVKGGEPRNQTSQTDKKHFSTLKCLIFYSL